MGAIDGPIKISIDASSILKGPSGPPLKMTPERTGRATLVDLLDKILDKGLVLNADLVISLAGVPLLAVCLNTAIASVETMQRYGLMRDLIKP